MVGSNTYARTAPITAFLTTGGSSLPVSMGMSLTRADEYYDKYLRDEDLYSDEITQLDMLLRSNGYEEKQIKSLKMRIRNRLKGEEVDLRTPEDISNLFRNEVIEQSYSIYGKKRFKST